jgi:hypothetical protein
VKNALTGMDMDPATAAFLAKAPPAPVILAAPLEGQLYQGKSVHPLGRDGSVGKSVDPRWVRYAAILILTNELIEVLDEVGYERTPELVDTYGQLSALRRELHGLLNTQECLAMEARFR